MMSSSFGGRSGFIRRGGNGARFRIPSKITPELSPRNGNDPVAISYRLHQRRTNQYVRRVPWLVPARATCRPPCPRRSRTRQVWFRCTRFCDVGCGLRRGFSHLCQPEVQNLGASPLRDKDVGGLEVTMDDALTVSRIERVGNLDSRAAFPTPSGGCRSGASALRHPETP